MKTIQILTGILLLLLAPVSAGAAGEIIVATEYRGLGKTNPLIVDQILYPIIGASSAIFDTAQVQSELLALGIFKNVEVSLREGAEDLHRKTYLGAQPRNGFPGMDSAQNTATITVRAVPEERSPAM
ncbi:MAG: hypothetical protein SVR04_03170 [Spirochaetota bacterium]|nr:hypothetical protein [Spirochaetota bacterium]